MPCRILICDDNDDDVRFLLDALRSRGLAVETTRARDGEEAFKHLSEGAEFDFAILDQQLPRMSGQEVIELLRDQGRFPDYPLVILTSILGKEREQHLRRVGVHLILEKPYNLDGYLRIGESLATLCP